MWFYLYSVLCNKIRVRTKKQKYSKYNRVAFSSTPAQTPTKALKTILVSTIITIITTPTSRVLTTLYKKTLSNKGVADLSIIKYYNYNKFSYYTTSYI